MTRESRVARFSLLLHSELRSQTLRFLHKRQFSSWDDTAAQPCHHFFVATTHVLQMTGLRIADSLFGGKS